VNTLTGAKYTQTTDNKGAYRFLNVPANQGYTVTFSHAGFASQKVEKFPLLVGSSRTLDAKLVAGNVEAVVVSGGSEITLDTTDASIGNNINVDILNELPIYDRTAGISTLFDLQAGVDFNSGAVTGARIDQTEVTLDGIDVNDIAAGTTFAVVANAPVDSVEQFGGTVAGLVPAVGTGSGGQFQLVTKSGTNKFHGNINEYHRDTSTAANTYFNNFLGLPRTPLIQNQFGGNIGGPILKDKLFFFFEINESRIVQSATGEDTVPLSNLTAANPTLNYINSNPGCDSTARLTTAPNCITGLSASQVQALDPANVGFNASLLSFLKGRFPAANDFSQGDGVNTGGYRFTVPTPNNTTTYVSKIDYNLTPKQFCPPTRSPTPSSTAATATSSATSGQSVPIRSTRSTTATTSPSLTSPTPTTPPARTSLASAASVLRTPATTARSVAFPSRRCATTSTGSSAPTTSPWAASSSSSRPIAT
jgi:hypothetical protein